MPDEIDPAELRQSLNKLHDELIAMDDVSPETETLLRALAIDIQSVLDGKPDHDAKAANDIISRWKDVVLEFESHHPRITQIADVLTTTIANMGL